MFRKTSLYRGALPLAVATALLSAGPGPAQAPIVSGQAALSPGTVAASPGAVAHIRVRVPPGAELWFDDTKMPQVGPVRQFRTPPLTPGKGYYYTVRARWTTDGREDSQTRTVFVAPGDFIDLDFPVAAWAVTTGSDGRGVFLVRY
jgi:uncharacterized protein (TIGR03000 family)